MKHSTWCSCWYNKPLDAGDHLDVPPHPHLTLLQAEVSRGRAQAGGVCYPPAQRAAPSSTYWAPASRLQQSVSTAGMPTLQPEAPGLLWPPRADVKRTPRYRGVPCAPSLYISEGHFLLVYAGGEEQWSRYLQSVLDASPRKMHLAAPDRLKMSKTPELPYGQI